MPVGSGGNRIGYVTPDDEREGGEKPSARSAKQGSSKPGCGALPGTERNEKIRPPQDPAMLLIHRGSLSRTQKLLTASGVHTGGLLEVSCEAPRSRS